MSLWLDIGGIAVGCTLLFLHTTYGYANTLDRVSLFLHRHAQAHRRRHTTVAKMLHEAWGHERRKPVPKVFSIDKENVS